MLSSDRLLSCFRCFFLGFAALLAGPAFGQEAEPRTLRLDGLTPGGARRTATESWGTFDFQVTNLTGVDRQARVVLFFAVRPDVQYGRDLWIPARSTVSSWILVGPCPPQQNPSGTKNETGRDIESLLFDRTDGQDRLVLPTTQERVRSRVVLYKQRNLFTTIVLDEDLPEEYPFGQLPQPEPLSEEALRLARVLRSALNLPDHVQKIHARLLPVSATAFDGVNHVVIGTNQIAHNPLGLQALRHWLQQGGTVWVMLDMVEPETIAPLLGDTLDFQIVDRVHLTNFIVKGHGPGAFIPARQQHENPVSFARVLLPADEKVRYTLDGWPLWFTRPVGWGKVLFTTLGARGLYQVKTTPNATLQPATDSSLPAPTPPLADMSNEFLAPPEKSAFKAEAFQPLLTEEIGYSVIGREIVLLIFGGFLAAALGAGFVLRSSRRRDWLGWIGPVAAVGAAAVFLALGEWSRHLTPETTALAQIVAAVDGKEEAAVHGLMAVYRPQPGAVEVGIEQGGFLDLDMSGIEGKTRQLILTDQGAWHWDHLSLPTSVRWAPFQFALATGEPIEAVARFGPDGLEGRLTAGPFHGFTDAVLRPPQGRRMTVTFQPDGGFRVAAQDSLPEGQFLTGTVLSDRQQRRQELYREFLKRRLSPPADDRNVLFAWTEPIDLHFRPGPASPPLGGGLLVVHLRVERSSVGSRVTVPGPLIPFWRILEQGPSRPTLEGTQAADMHLRFQLPAEVWPLRLERARVTAKIVAPGRAVTFATRKENATVPLLQVESPLEVIQLDLTEEALARLDEQGGLHLNLNVGSTHKTPPVKGQRPELETENWVIEYLEIEVTGVCQ